MFNGSCRPQKRQRFDHKSRISRSCQPSTSISLPTKDEFYVELNIGHERAGKNPKKWNYKVRWLGCETDDNTMLDWAAVKDLAALDENSRDDSHPNYG